MNHTLLERAKVFLQAHKNKSIWHRITTSLAAVVVFVTTYMLILPAITMERPTGCGLEEHTHTKACYASSLKAALHEHDASCYDANGSLVCQRPVVRLHEHTDECYKDSNLICGQIAYQGHTHTDACYTWEKVLVCGDGAGSSINADGEILIDEGAVETPQTSAHVHTDDCYRMEKVLTCLLAEGPGHTHTAACYDGPRQLICGHVGMAEIIWPDSPVEYVSANDTGKILICGKKEHKHTDSCYADETPQSETKAQTEPQAIVVAETEAVTEPQAITETEAVTEAEAETQIVTEAQTELVTEAQNTTEAETQVVTETEAVTEPQVATEAETQIATEAQTEQVTETQIATEAQTEPVTEAQTELVTETQNTTEAETQVVTDTEAETQIATEAQTELVTETQTEFSTEIESESETASEVEPETATETATEMAAEPEPETEFSTEIESESEAVSEAETESGTEIQTETETEAETETETETEAESEIGTEAETETESEIGTEAEIETETESDTESETEIESETGTWTDEALEEAFEKGQIDSYCVVQRGISQSRTRRVMRASNAGNNTAVDFEQYLTYAKLSKLEGGVWKDTTEVKDGDQVKILLEYSMPANKVTVSNKKIYYQLPAAVKLLDEQNGRVYFNGVAVGNYKISKDGLIEIEFFDEFANGQAFTGDIEFSGMVTEAGASSDGKFSFGESGTVIEFKKEEQRYDLNIEKKGELNEGKDKIQYTIKAGTTTGTEGNVTITDKFVKSGVTAVYNKDSFKVWRVDKNGNKREVTGYTPIISKTGEGVETFEIKNLPKLEAGERYEVNYSANISINKDDNNTKEISNSAGMKSGKEEKWTWNTVAVAKKMISKGGFYDNNENIINWEIMVNEDQRDISGYELKDALQDSEAKIIGDISIYNSKGEVLQTISGNGGNSFSYTFPNGSKDTYTVKYKTSAPKRDGNVTNSAELKKEDKKYSSSKDIGISHRKWGLSKNFDSESTDSNGVVHYKWQTLVTLPENDVSEFVYTDTIIEPVSNLGAVSGDRHYALATELVKKIKESFVLTIGQGVGDTGFESNQFVDIQLTFWDENGNVVGEENTTAHVQKFEVKVSPKTDKTFEWKQLFFKYETIAYYTGMQPDEKWTFKNQGALKDITVKSEHSYTMPKPLKKYLFIKDMYGNPSLVDGVARVDMDKVNKILTYCIVIRTSPTQNEDIVIKDMLPTGVELLEESLYGRFFVNEYNQKEEMTYWDDSNHSIRYSFSDEQKPIGKLENGVYTITVKGGYNDPYKTPEKGETIAVFYQVSVKNDPYWKDLKNETNYYTNHAEWGGYSDDQKTEVTRVVSKLKKEGKQIQEKVDGELKNTNRVRYTICINPGGLDLDPDRDTITLTDTLTVASGKGADLNLNTVKLYRYDARKPDGIGGLVPVSDYVMKYDADQHKMVLTIPDELGCILIYEYTIDAGNVETPSVTNKAELYGNYSSTTSTSLQDISSSANVSRKRFEIYKVDSSNYSVLLDGAQFKLESWDGETWKEEGIYTAKDGYLDLGEAMSTQESEKELAYEKLYRVTEEKAPNGYEKTDKAYYFIFINPKGSSNEDTIWNTIKGKDQCGPDKSSVQFVGKNGTVVYVPNKATSIRVQKVWVDSDGNTVDKTGTVDVNVYQCTKRMLGCEVTLRFVDADGKDYNTAYTKVTEKIYVKKGSKITYQANRYGVWGLNWYDLFQVEINGVQDTTTTGTINSQNESIICTTGSITEDCVVTIKNIGKYHYGDPSSSSYDDIAGRISYVSAKDYEVGERNFYKKISLNSVNNWSYQLTDLPSKVNGQEVCFLVEEIGGENYNAFYVNNAIQSGDIYIKNIIPNKDTSYILPETGGPGSRMYMIGGAVLALLAVILLYIKTVSRRCMADCATPSENDHFRNDCSGLLFGGSNKRGKEDSKSP